MDQLVLELCSLKVKIGNVASMCNSCVNNSPTVQCTQYSPKFLILIILIFMLFSIKEIRCPQVLQSCKCTKTNMTYSHKYPDNYQQYNSYMQHNTLIAVNIQKYIALNHINEFIMIKLDIYLYRFK